MDTRLIRSTSIATGPRASTAVNSRDHRRWRISKCPRRSNRLVPIEKQNHGQENPIVVASNSVPGRPLRLCVCRLINAKTNEGSRCEKLMRKKLSTNRPCAIDCFPAVGGLTLGLNSGIDVLSAVEIDAAACAHIPDQPCRCKLSILISVKLAAQVSGGD